MSMVPGAVVVVKWSAAGLLPQQSEFESRCSQQFHSVKIVKKEGK